MSNIGNRISEVRKAKKLTQEDLAELAKVNLRTIQRIEKNENEPRGKTLNLVCNALDLKIEDFQINANLIDENKIGGIIVNGFFLVVLNIVLMSIYGFLTFDSEANLNSVFGAFLLSFLLPFFIVWKTQKMANVERVLKFGLGFVVYFLIVVLSKKGFVAGFKTGLFPCLSIALATLYYGGFLFKKE